MDDSMMNVNSVSEAGAGSELSLGAKTSSYLNAFHQVILKLTFHGLHFRIGVEKQMFYYCDQIKVI